MINYISGRLSEIGEGEITVETHGVGYRIFLTPGAVMELPPVGSELRVYTYFNVGEDALSLYGFLYRDEREMFRLLIRVSGVGPRAAMAILGTLSIDELRMAIAFEDASTISRAPGIGKKTAERVILDLRDKIGLVGESQLAAPGAPASASSRAPAPTQEAIEALAALGYSRVEAGRAVSRIELDSSMTTEDILRLALKNIGTL